MIKIKDEKEKVFNIYQVNKDNEDWELLTQFGNIKDIENYLGIKQDQVYKVISKVKKHFMNGNQILIIKEVR